MIDQEDAAVICEWMEPKPSEKDYREFRHFYWWRPRTVYGDPQTFEDYYPVKLTFIELWEVEERLTAEQRFEYWLDLAKGGPPDTGYWRILHATAEQKIKALAAVIRGTHA